MTWTSISYIKLQMVVKLPKMTPESSFKKENVDNSSFFNFTEPEFLYFEVNKLYLPISVGMCRKQKSLPHRVFPGGPPSKYYPGPTMLNFRDQTRTGVFIVVWS